MNAKRLRERALRELHDEWEREQVEVIKARLRRRAYAWFWFKSLFTFWRS